MGARSWLGLVLLLLSPSFGNAYSQGDSFLHLGDTGYAQRSHADVEDLEYAKDFSIETVLYIPPHTATKRWGGIFTKTRSSGLWSAKDYPGFGLAIYGGDSDGFAERIRAKVGDGTYHVTIDSPPANGIVHVVVTWDKTAKAMSMYVKGHATFDPEANTNIDPLNIKNDEPFKIGYCLTSLEREVIYVRLWNRLISADEAGTLWDHYNNTKKHTLPAGFNRDNLHSEWLMDETSDWAGNTGVTHIYDSAGVNHLELKHGASVIKGSGTLELDSPKPPSDDPPSDDPPSDDPPSDPPPAHTSVTLIAKGGAESLGVHTPPLHYQFQIAEDPGFSMNLKESDWIANFSEWKPILKPGTTYYWRAQVKDSEDNTSTYTDTWSFETEDARDWWVRPKREPGYGAGDGSSYADAWNGTKNIVFGPDGVEAGDNLYICGVHLLKTESGGYTTEGLVTITESGFSDEYPITIRMDCPDDEGLLWGYFLDQRNGQDEWTHVADGVYRTESINKNFAGGGVMQDIDGWSGTLLKRLHPDTCSAQEVEAAWTDTSGAWCMAGNTAYLKTTDGGDPTGRIYESRWGYWIDMGWSNYIKFYNCNFYGSKPYNKYPFYVDKKYVAGKEVYIETVSDELPSTDITFDSTKIQYLPGKMISPLLLNDRWTVRNCELAYGANAVYSISSMKDYYHLSPNQLVVENNRIHDIGDTGHGNFRDGDSHAVGIQGGSNHLIQNNLIERTGSSIVLFASAGQNMRDNIIRNNVLKDIYAQASYGGVAIALSGDATAEPLGERTGNRFYNNIVLGAQGHGITSNAPDLVRIYNNLFYNITSPPDLDIYGTRHNLANHGLKTFADKGSHYLGHNNMFVNVKDYYAVITYGDIQEAPFLEWDHNLYYNETPKETYDFFYPPTGLHYVPSWIEDTDYDKYAIATDPLLVISKAETPYLAIEKWDVRLAETSPAIDAGFDMQRESDIYGNPIYGKPDIGPVEYQPEHDMGEFMGSETTVYADGKFRIASNTIEADLAVSPAGGWQTFGHTEHRPQWMKIQIQKWKKPLEWVETVSSQESVIHTVGGRDPNVECQVYIDGVLVSSQTSDADGHITFTNHLTAEHHVKVLCWDEPVTVQVIQGGNPVEGAKVYLFGSTGAYLGRNAVTDSAGEASFLLPVDETFQFRADVLGGQFFSDAVTVVDDGQTAVPLDTGGGLLTLTLETDEDTPMAGVKAYLFSESGAYLGLSATTNEDGQVIFEVPSGEYKARADYLGYQFWSKPVTVASDADVSMMIPQENVVVEIVGKNDEDAVPQEDVPVYLFTAQGAYQGISETTGPAGEVIFSLPPGDYKFRADYLNGHHWSEVIDQMDSEIPIEIPEGLANVSVSMLGEPLEEVSVYVFDEAGAYLGLTKTTDAKGIVGFRLPEGDYNFRADLTGRKYYSGVTTVIADQDNPITVNTGGANFTLTVLERPDAENGQDPWLSGVTCYLFSADGAYLGHQAATSEHGTAGFDLPDGDYKIRIDQLGYQYWTPAFTIPDQPDLVHLIDHQDVVVTVQRQDDSRTPPVAPLGGVKTFLFTANGAYQGISEYTDSYGRAFFLLPPADYTVRVDYLNAHYWTGAFTQVPQVVTIHEGTAQVKVLLGTSPVTGSTVYVFDINGAYLGIHDVTDGAGLVEFQLPEGAYKFRADFQSNQYWITEQITAHQINKIELSTGGGAFELIIQKDVDDALVNVPVYVFSEAGSYLGMTQAADSHGRVTFDLGDGSYKFRVDYMGYRFWTDVSTVPEHFSDELTISHTDVTVSVSSEYDTEIHPIAGIKVYLFTEAGAYQGISQTTDADGFVEFALPAQRYKVRADYLGKQYWRAPILPPGDASVRIDIPHGMADIHVTESDANVVGAKVYLFTENGAYLGRYETTDGGHARFVLPEGSYKFRVDYNNGQYWSDKIILSPHGETDVPMELTLLAMDQSTPDNTDERMEALEMGALSLHVPIPWMLSRWEFSPSIPEGRWGSKE